MSLGISRRCRAVDMFGHLAEDLEISRIGQPVDGKHPRHCFGEAELSCEAGRRMQPAVHGRRGDRLEKFEASKFLKYHAPIAPAHRRIEPVECRKAPRGAGHCRIAEFVNQLLAERTPAGGAYGVPQISVGWFLEK